MLNELISIFNFLASFSVSLALVSSGISSLSVPDMVISILDQSHQLIVDSIWTDETDRSLQVIAVSDF